MKNTNNINTAKDERNGNIQDPTVKLIKKRQEEQ